MVFLEDLFGVLLIFPAFRIHVRHEYFDVAANNLGWATGLFEAKEHWGAVLMALLLALYCLRRDRIAAILAAKV